MATSVASSLLFFLLQSLLSQADVMEDLHMLQKEISSLSMEKRQAVNIAACPSKFVVSCKDCVKSKGDCSGCWTVSSVKEGCIVCAAEKFSKGQIKTSDKCTRPMSLERDEFVEENYCSPGEKEVAAAKEKIKRHLKEGRLKAPKGEFDMDAQHTADFYISIIEEDCQVDPPGTQPGKLDDDEEEEDKKEEKKEEAPAKKEPYEPNFGGSPASLRI